MYITNEALLKVFPKALPIILKTIQQNQYEFYKRQVNTPIRLVHFFAQCGHETMGLTKLEEIAPKSTYDGGVTYRGRGLIQLTGKLNYKWIGGLLKVNLVDDPMKVLLPPYLLTTALEFWSKMGLNKLADEDKVLAITRKINGGYNGLDERKKYVRQLKQALLS